MVAACPPAGLRGADAGNKARMQRVAIIRYERMKTIDIASAAANLEELLERALAGEPVIISIDGRPVARLLPVGDGDHEDDAPGHEVEEAFHGD